MAATRAAAAAAASSSAGADRCHFAVLGLPRSATRDQVKQAYRRLARQWHPDVNSAPEAVERFKLISQAFEVLSDPLLRQQYEESQWGTDTSGSSGSGSSSSSNGGASPDVHALLQLGFREAILGAQRDVLVSVLDTCPHCGGTGAQPGSSAPPCPCCKGRREIVKRQRNASSTDAGASTSVVCCPICAGRGFQVRQRCTCCRGAALTQQPRSVPVSVPPGVEHGSLLRVPHEGSVTRPGGPRGTVVLEVQVEHEPGMWRRGLDLHSQLQVPFLDALLGGTHTVPTVWGNARLSIPPGTQHGSVLSLDQAGVRRQGSHHFQVQLLLPREVSSAEQELLQQLAVLQRRRRRRQPRGSSSSSSS
ncbi:dnaJ-like protein subfamily A member 2-like [Chlorella sorokiniana]|uniref:DnaJ-like protein subfamily A member 2-like n=1 Tax=Chlorella sorokiniana TaxID=3076 RepID=A0A2P6U0X4_CHLSO|nr:dnaJ-like protein subfamily A member 2-like [Chlorella sorokiniana]|eukprot:PRW59959.1 dnaJ-like protein subfamily A member 2-like [Chlorella sorokiniana]